MNNAFLEESEAPEDMNWGEESPFGINIHSINIQWRIKRQFDGDPAWSAFDEDVLFVVKFHPVVILEQDGAVFPETVRGKDAQRSVMRNCRDARWNLYWTLRSAMFEVLDNYSSLFMDLRRKGVNMSKWDRLQHKAMEVFMAKMMRVYDILIKDKPIDEALLQEQPEGETPEDMEWGEDEVTPSYPDIAPVYYRTRASRPRYTRHFYILVADSIAAAIHKAKAEAEREGTDPEPVLNAISDIAMELVRRFMADNALFSPARFYARCGIN